MKLFKKVIPILLFMVLLLGITHVSAVYADSYSVNLNSTFTVAKADDDFSKISSVLGMKTDEIEKFVKENDVLFIAANDENSVQVRLSKYKTEFSTLAVDISRLDDEGLKELAESISSESSGFTVDTSNERRYIKGVRNLSDSGGKYVSTQYTTVMDGYIYQLSVYAAEGSAENTADKIFSGTVLYPQDDETTVPVLYTIGFAVLIALFTTLFVVALVGLIKNRKSAQEDDQPEENTEAQ